jgi:hypothetical protein
VRAQPASPRSSLVLEGWSSALDPDILVLERIGRLLGVRPLGSGEGDTCMPAAHALLME